MTNPFAKVGRRLGLSVASGLLLLSVGCGWTHGRYASDPMLGNFNRPIAATPPIFTGGDPGTSPAYDGGARLGLASPDVPQTQKTNEEHIFIMPTYQGGLGLGGALRGSGSSNGSGGASGRYSTPLPTGGNGGGALFNRLNTQANIGARLPSLEPESERTAMFVPGMVTPLSGSAVASGRPRDVHSVLTNGSSLAADIPKAKADPVKDALANPQQVATIEQAHTLLTTCGAKTQALDQVPTGEWRFVCTMGDGSDYRQVRRNP